MSNEPDGFWDTRIEPDDYPVLVHNCKTRLDEAGRTLCVFNLPLFQLLHPLFTIITARIPNSERRRYCFHKCLCVHTRGYLPLAGWGGVPTLDRGGYLPWMLGTYSRQGGEGVPTPGGYLPWTWGNPGVPPVQTWGIPPPPSRASTSYVAGGMPVTFTQEDFLVSWKIFLIIQYE